MYTFLSIIYIMICFFLIFVVLLQPGRGGMGSAFGSGSSQTVFGASGGANFLQKLTTISAALFMLLSVTLAYMSSTSDKVLEAAGEAARAKAAAKAALEAANKEAAGQVADEPGAGAFDLQEPAAETFDAEEPSEAESTTDEDTESGEGESAPPAGE